MLADVRAAVEDWLPMRAKVNEITDDLDGVGGMPEDEMRLILGGTAVDVFNFDVDTLNAVAQRIGPAISDIADPVN